MYYFWSKQIFFNILLWYLFGTHLFASSISNIMLGFPGDADGKESACNVRDLGSTPGLGRSPGEGNG